MLNSKLPGVQLFAGGVAQDKLALMLKLRAIWFCTHTIAVSLAQAQ